MKQPQTEESPNGVEPAEAARGVIELGSGPFITPDVPVGGGDRFDPRIFVEVGQTFEDIWMRSALDGEEAVVARMVISHYLFHVCGLVVPLHDIRLWLISSSAVKGRAREELMNVAMAMMAAQTGGARGGQQPPGDAKGAIAQLLGIGRRG